MTVGEEPSPQLIEAVRATDGLASMNVPLKITELCEAVAKVVAEDNEMVAVG